MPGRRVVGTSLLCVAGLSICCFCTSYLCQASTWAEVSFSFSLSHPAEYLAAAWIFCSMGGWFHLPVTLRAKDAFLSSVLACWVTRFFGSAVILVADRAFPPTNLRTLELLNISSFTGCTPVPCLCQAFFFPLSPASTHCIAPDILSSLVETPFWPPFPGLSPTHLCCLAAKSSKPVMQTSGGVWRTVYTASWRCFSLGNGSSVPAGLGPLSPLALLFGTVRKVSGSWWSTLLHLFPLL
jgi:hypothetical protein